jgi:3-phenylpropionate/trans-cinnamate dioxygenase ferredoxin reductase subunit
MAASRHVVIVGGGLAGWRAAEELRAAGFSGQLTLLSAEEHPPYDRPPLSKRLLKADVEATPITLAREGSDESTLQLDLRRGVRATGLSPGVVLTEEVAENRAVSGKVSYDALVIATGVRARELPMLAGHPRVFLLRTFDDVLALRKALDTARSLLVVGAGFIGAEVATAAHDRGLAVTVIEALDVPYERTLGPLLGGIVGRMAGRYGVSLRTGTGVEELLDSPESVHVKLSDGSTLDADIAVVGVGTQLNVEWLAATDVDHSRGVRCDGSGRVTGLAPEYGPVYALGDVAAWHDATLEGHLRFEHWTTAVDQAPVLARTLVRDLAGEHPEPAERLMPYFWSDQYGRKVQLLGRPSVADSVEVLHGEEPPEQDATAPRKLLAGYFAAGRLVAIAGISAPALLGKYRALLDAGAALEQVQAHAASLVQG